MYVQQYNKFVVQTEKIWQNIKFMLMFMVISYKQQQQQPHQQRNNEIIQKLNRNNWNYSWKTNLLLMIREKQNKKKPQKKREKILYLKTITADTLHMQQCCIVIPGDTEKKEFWIFNFLSK